MRNLNIRDFKNSNEDTDKEIIIDEDLIFPSTNDSDLEITDKQENTNEPEDTGSLEITDKQENIGEDNPSPSDNSSVTDQGNPSQEPIEDKVLDESYIINYLSEKLGKKINNIDDLKQTPQENPLEKDPYLKELYLWREKTGRPIEDWIKFQKDYSKLKDIDIAREYLQYEYPELSEEDIAFELTKFISDEDDLDHEIKHKNLELKKYASKGRNVLSTLVSQLGEPDKNFKLPTEIAEDLEIAKRYKESYNSQVESNKIYQENIKKATDNSSVYKLNLGEGIVVDFKLPEDKKDLPTFIDTMPHWYNEDGIINPKSVVEDGIKIKYFKEIVDLAYNQGLSAGKEAIIKDAKNINMKEPIPNQGEDNVSDVIIEGGNHMFKKNNLSLRTFKKN